MKKTERKTHIQQSRNWIFWLQFQDVQSFSYITQNFLKWESEIFLVNFIFLQKCIFLTETSHLNIGLLKFSIFSPFPQQMILVPLAQWLSLCLIKPTIPDAWFLLPHPSHWAYLLEAMDVSKVQALKHINSCEHLALPKAAWWCRLWKWMLRYSFLCHVVPWGIYPRMQLCGLDKGFSTLSDPQVPTPDKG